MRAEIYPKCTSERQCRFETKEIASTPPAAAITPHKRGEVGFKFISRLFTYFAIKLSRISFGDCLVTLPLGRMISSQGNKKATTVEPRRMPI